MGISKKVTDRIVSNVKSYQATLENAKARDINESDTVIIIADMLTDIFGYKKHEEVTTELAIRGTFCDLAIKVDDDFRFLIEAKAIGIELKEAHIKQAIDYGANKGIEWVILTNGQRWQFYRIHFKQPIDKTLVFDLCLLNVKANDEQLIECFGNLCRECYSKSSLAEFYAQQQAVSKYMIASILMSDTVISAVKREIKKIAPRLHAEDEQISLIIQNDIVKREVLDSDEAKNAQADYKKATRRYQSAKNKDKETSDTTAPTILEKLKAAVA